MSQVATGVNSGRARYRSIVSRKLAAVFAEAWRRSDSPIGKRAD